MSLNLTDMRSLVRKGLGDLLEADLSNEWVDRYLNMALWHLWLKWPFKERECVIYTETQDGVSEYGLPEDNLLDSIMSVGIKDGAEEERESSYSPLGLITHQEYDDRHVEREDARAKPTTYFRLKHTLVVDPVPDDVYTIRVTFWLTVRTLLENDVETTELPPNWDELVVEGAISRGHFYNEDYQSASAADQFQRQKIRDATLIRDKELVNARYYGLQVLHSDPTGDR